MKVKIKCYKTIGKNEDFKNNEIGELDDEKQFSTPINQNKINETTKITAKKNPSRTSGIKYIVSEVSPDNNDIDCDIDEEITIVDNNSFIKIIEPIYLKHSEEKKRKAHLQVVPASLVDCEKGGALKIRNMKLSQSCTSDYCNPP